MSQAVQDLGVLVANVEAGVLVHRDEPNYALLEAATATIKIVLNRLMSGGFATSHRAPHEASNDCTHATAVDPWLPWQMESDPLDFEVDFWMNLAEHPAFSCDPA